MSNPQHALSFSPLLPAHHECNPANISYLARLLAFFMLTQSFRSSQLTHKSFHRAGCIKSPQVNTRGDFNFISEASDPGEHSSPA